MRIFNRLCSIVVGICFLATFFYPVKAAVVLSTLFGGWHGIANVVAVGFFLLGVLPRLGLTHGGKTSKLHSLTDEQCRPGSRC